MATLPTPYVDLMAPDWAARAALAIAADLCDRSGIQDEMRRLDQAMRHEMIAFQAGIIRNEWSHEAREIPPLPGMGELVAVPDTSDDLVAAQRLLDLSEAAFLMIEMAAKGNDFANPAATLAYVQGLAAGAQSALHQIRRVRDETLAPGNDERRPA